jgi:hypothetical protein
MGGADHNDVLPLDRDLVRQCLAEAKEAREANQRAGFADLDAAKAVARTRELLRSNDVLPLDGDVVRQCLAEAKESRETKLRAVFRAFLEEEKDALRAHCCNCCQQRYHDDAGVLRPLSLKQPLLGLRNAYQAIKGIFSRDHHDD